jgi:hypothetical protein
VLDVYRTFDAEAILALLDSLEARLLDGSVVVMDNAGDLLADLRDAFRVAELPVLQCPSVVLLTRLNLRHFLLQRRSEQLRALQPSVNGTIRPTVDTSERFHDPRIEPGRFSEQGQRRDCWALKMHNHWSPVLDPHHIGDCRLVTM